MTKRVLLSVLTIVMAVGLGRAQNAAPTGEDEKDTSLTPEQIVDLSKKLEPSVAIVQYTLRMDKGEEPQASGSWSYYSPERLIQEERPMDVPGFLIDKTHVFTADVNIHPRFVESIQVKIAGKTVDAKISGVVIGNYGAIVELAEPVEGAVPLAFDAKADGPYLIVGVSRQNGRWLLRIGGMPVRIAAGEGQAEQQAPEHALVITEDGTPVGVTMSGQLPTDGSWKGSPLAFKAMSAEQLEALLEKTKAGSAGKVFRVTLKFRSPQQKGGMSEMGESATTEAHVPGILVDGKVLVLANMPPKLTARLEQILVHMGEEPVDATFMLTLKDYGAFLAALPKGAKYASAELATGDIRTWENQLVPAKDFRIQGEQETTYYQHQRISTIRDGWRGNLYPEIRGDESNMFLFDREGRLLAFPIARRQRATGRYGYGRERPQLTSAAQLKPVLADAANHADEWNTPLSEDEENRVAWMGVILQPMTKELAQINNVADLTRNGQTGALVSYVYKDSPADKAGVKAGWILIRLDVEGEPAPIDVQAPSVGQRDFPRLWQIYDKIPEELFVRIPRPWPVADNAFTRQLTDLGFGRKYAAEFFHDGKLDKVPFTIVKSPRHYDSAAKYKCEPLGMTVRDLTYELKLYFRRDDKEPGVVISRIEPGSKASIAGLKPYEIITQINDEPVASIEDFKKLTAGGGELSFGVKRWTDGRVVKVEVPVIDEPKSGEGEEPADDETDAEAPDAQPAGKAIEAEETVVE